MRQKARYLHKRAVCLWSLLKQFLTFPVYIGRYPGRVPGPAVILFPYLADRLSCGLTGIIAFNRNTPAPVIDVPELNRLLDRIRARTFTTCAEQPAGTFQDCYLDGADTVSKFLNAIRGLKQDAPFYSLFSDQKARENLAAMAETLAGLIAEESARENEQMGRMTTDHFEVMSERIERLKDAAWCIRTEIMGNLDKVRLLLRETVSAASPAIVSAARQVNAVLNSIDRLEVRGRDSAGVSLLFTLAGDNFAAFQDAIASRGLSGEYTPRVNPEILMNRSISVQQADGKASIALVYKVAEEIGRLGDNVGFLREQIRNDSVLTILLSLPIRHFSVLSHTRWASVGAINEANCHPVDNRAGAGSDAAGIIHVCLNGDIDNYQRLKNFHTKSGIRYSEEITTDTKIIPVQIAYYVRKGHGIEEAFRLAVNDFEGSHAIAMHSDLAPGKYFLALKGSGQAIFIGLAPDHYMPTSEVYGFVEETSRFLKMDGDTVHPGTDGRTVSGQICIIDQAGHGGFEGIRRMFYDGTPVAPKPSDIRETQLTSRDIDRQDFDHYFLKEISEAPGSVRKTLANRWKIIDDSRYEIILDETCVPDRLREALAENRIRRILFIGQGTAGVAALACANLMRHYLDDPTIRVEAMKSSELSGSMRHDGKQDMTDPLLVPISQSGTTADTNRTVDLVRKKGAWTVSIVNRRDSDLTFKSDGVLYTSSGRDIEMSVASTKAFYSQIIAGAVLGLYIAQVTGRRGEGFVSNEIKQMIALPDIMEEVLSMIDQIRVSAQRLALRRTYWAAVGSGPNKAAADEIRIKLSELCYKTISSDYVEDKKHIDLSSEPLIIICAAGTRRSVIGDIVKDTAIFKSHKALPVVICDAHEDRFAPYAEDVFHVPVVSEHLALIPNTLVGHIWGYYAALTINEGSRFLHDFREDLRGMIRAFSERNLDIFDIALEDTFRERILRFYREFRKRQFEDRLSATIGIRGATNVVLLLKYLAGRLPVTDFELDFGIKGTAKNMFALFFESLGEAINHMARPVDAIKHQAKTVTVGTSRIEEKAEGLLFDVLAEKGFGIDHLTLTNVMVLRNLQKIIATVNGSTLYHVAGINLMGEPTDASTISVLEKTGTSAAIISRSETDRTLKGSKRIIVRQGNVYIGKGRKDDRSIMIIPILSGDPTRPNMVERLLLLEVEFLADVDLETRIKALGGKYEHIKNLAQESSLPWTDGFLEQIPMEELFGRSAEKIAEMIVDRHS